MADKLKKARDPLGGKEGYGGFSYYKNGLVDEVIAELDMNAKSEVSE